jgi:hypothetical protein
MGQGKTAAITPLLLLQDFAALRQPPKKYFVILPEHLISSSFDILFKYAQLLPDIRTVFKNQTNDTSELFILSVSAFKKTILKAINDHKEESTANIYEELFDMPNLFIYDEIDMLMDPFKCDLNLTDTKNAETTHALFDLIIHVMIEVVSARHNGQPITDDIIVANIDNWIDDYYNSLPKSRESSKDRKKIKDNLRTKIGTILGSPFIHNRHYGLGNLEATELANVRSVTDLKSAKYKDLFVAVPYSANNSPVAHSSFSDFELAIYFTVQSYWKSELRAVDLLLLLDTRAKEYNLAPALVEPFLYSVVTEFLQCTDYSAQIKYCDTLIEEWKTLNSNDICGVLQRLKDDASEKDKAKHNKCLQARWFWHPEQATELKKEYLKAIIFPNKIYFPVTREQLNISTIDLFDPRICRDKVVAFTGTSNVHLYDGDIGLCTKLFPDNQLEASAKLFDEVSSNRVDQGEIISSIIGNTTRAASFQSYEVNGAPEKIEQDFIGVISEPNFTTRYQALIDCGGLIISKSAIDVIKLLWKTYKNNRKAEEASAKSYKRFLYADSSGKRLIYNDANGTVYPTPYNNEVFDDVFIYYDNKHTVGLDFKQPATMHGLTTVNTNTTLTQISQAIYRLRNIKYGHSVNYYLPNTIIQAEDGVDSQARKYQLLLKFFNTNEEKYKDKTKFTAQLQCARYVNRYVNPVYASYKTQIYYTLLKLQKPGTNNSEYVSENEFNKWEVASLTRALRNRGIELKLQVPVQDNVVDIKTNVKEDVKESMQETLPGRHTIKLDEPFIFVHPLPAGLTHRTVSQLNEPLTEIIYMARRIAPVPDNFNNLEIGDWKVNHSYMYNYFLIKPESTNKLLFQDSNELANVYNTRLYVYDPTKSTTITVISLIEYMLLRTYIQNQPNLAPKIIIINKYYNIVWPEQKAELDESIELPLIPSYIIALLFEELGWENTYRGLRYYNDIEKPAIWLPWSAAFNMSMAQFNYIYADSIMLVYKNMYIVLFLIMVFMFSNNPARASIMTQEMGSIKRSAGKPTAATG